MQKLENLPKIQTNAISFTQIPFAHLHPQGQVLHKSERVHAPKVHSNIRNSHKSISIRAMHFATRDPSARKSLYTTIITLHQFMCIDLYWHVLYLHNIKSVPRRKTAFSSVLSDCRTSVITQISVQSKLSLGKFDNL